MNKKTEFVNQQARTGRWLILGGVALFVIGLILQFVAGGLGFNPRIISGLGILLAGVGAGRLVLASAARKDPAVQRQLYVEQQDERLLAIRNLSAARAYVASLVLAMAGLMWVSFSANGSLPALSQDALWFYLAGLVILPFVVYTGSMIVEQQRK